MAKFTVTNEINCDADAFWKLFIDKDFNLKLYKEGLGFPEFEILEQTENDREIRRKARGMPKMDAPAAIQKMLGSGFRYTEEGTLDKTAKVWRWKMTPSAMADKMRNEGTMRIEPAGPGKVRRIAELIIEVKIFGLGGMMESFAEKNLRDGWNRSATYMNDWIRSGK